MPFLNVDLPLKGFFVLGPALFLIVHAYVLLHFVHARPARSAAFDSALREQIDDAEIRTRLAAAIAEQHFRAVPGRAARGEGWGHGPAAVADRDDQPGGGAGGSGGVLRTASSCPTTSEWITWWQRMAVGMRPAADVAVLAVDRAARPAAAGAGWREATDAAGRARADAVYHVGVEQRGGAADGGVRDLPGRGHRHAAMEIESVHPAETVGGGARIPGRRAGQPGLANAAKPVVQPSGSAGSGCH